MRFVIAIVLACSVASMAYYAVTASRYSATIRGVSGPMTAAEIRASRDRATAYERAHPTASRPAVQP